MIVDGSVTREMHEVRLSKLATVAVRIPYRSPIGFATGNLTVAEHVLVLASDVDGVVGIGEATPHLMIDGETIKSVVSCVEEAIAPRLQHVDIASSERVQEALSDIAGNPTARAAVEFALSDLIGRRLGISCWRMLGAYDSRLAVTAVLGFGKPEDIADEALEHVEHFGIRSFKVKVGRDVALDVATCRAVRDAVGPDAIVYADANHGFDIFEALDFDARVRELSLAWIEEPCSAERPVDRRRAVQLGALTVVGDESCGTIGAVVREVSAGRCEAVSLKVGRTGIYQAEQIRSYCEAAGVPLIMGSAGESAVGTLGAATYAAGHRSTSRYPAEHSWFLHEADSISIEAPVIVGGELVVPDLPGWGVEIDETKLAKYRVD
jgi:L-alanine-DL-glutamate epimerase-like enolase superfamily enzyme